MKLFLACGVVGLWAASASAAAQTDGNSAKNQTNAAPNILQQEIPKSVFVPAASPKEGRNPFFPQSMQVVAQPARVAPTQIDPSAIVLNGITPSGPKRTAMINGKTFEASESGEIRMPAGNKVLIKCEEIRADSVIIIVDGLRRELKMRFGL